MLSHHQTNSFKKKLNFYNTDQSFNDSLSSNEFELLPKKQHLESSFLNRINEIVMVIMS